ncbi:MAG: PQQ-binding-like beta-propeller repeat protein, partial [Isosphaeraceae bacterium]
MILSRSAKVTLLLLLPLLPALAFGQTKDAREKEDKVSNDDPARPLQMPPASTEVKEAIDDFDRFQRRGAWERALKSLYTIPDNQALRFIDGENGFIIPIERKRRMILSALPPNGQAACRLFYDAEAKKLLDEADGPSELKNLERIYSAYFITSVGDNAADRLGDLYFEAGRFDRAADCWLAILRERPDTDLSPALITVKAAVALFRAGRQSEFEQVRAELVNRYADEKLTIGGRTAPAGALLQGLLDDAKASDADRSASHAEEMGPELGGTVDPEWQMRFAESVEAGMTPQELTQWETNPLSIAVPAVTIEGSTLFANYLGFDFALDLKSGKMLWRTAFFHNLDVLGMQQQARFVDTSRFAILASGEHLWCLERDMRDQNFMAPFHLICRRADTGEVVWKSGDLADYATFDLVGRPILADGKLFITAKSGANPQMPRQGQPQQFVLAIQPHDGKLLWKTEVGLFRQGQQQMFFFRYNSQQSSPQPQLLYRAGRLYVDTHIGVLGRLDADTGLLDWGYGYKTAPSQSQSRFFYYYQPQEPMPAGSPPVESGEAFLIKGSQSDRLYAIEPNRMKVLWERPIEKATRLLGVVDQTAFLGGAEISALDLQTRRLLWATRLPNDSLSARILVRPDGVWQLTPRGIFEIDPKSGQVRRIFRGKDLGAVGGDLVLTDQWLLAISNRTISAYPRRAAPGAQITSRQDSATT